MAVVLGTELAAFPFLRDRSFAGRARWLHRVSVRLLRAVDARVHAAGPLPRGGLIVSNHLSYLDIPAIASVCPVLFVAKREVASWPVFGCFAALSGSVFVDRQRRTNVDAVNRDIRIRLDAGVAVLMFPEATSSGGVDVLPFRPALLEPVVAAGGPVTPVAIDYAIPQGDVAEEVCYWKDMVFGPHLVRLLGISRIEVFLTFGEPQAAGTDRKRLAVTLRERVAAQRTTRGGVQ